MSYILRHGAKQENIEIDSNGWVLTSDLIFISKKFNHMCDLDTIEHIVKTNSKKRYELSLDLKFIRAFQGHSEASVNIQFKEQEAPDILFHGTSIDNLIFIKKDGIKKMSRLYVHLSEDLNTAKKVGIRHAKDQEKLIILEINASQMQKDGFKFFLSENNVWLTEHISPEYIKNKI